MLLIQVGLLVQIRSFVNKLLIEVAKRVVSFRLGPHFLGLPVMRLVSASAYFWACGLYWATLIDSFYVYGEAFEMFLLLEKFEKDGLNLLKRYLLHRKPRQF